MTILHSRGATAVLFSGFIALSTLSTPALADGPSRTITVTGQGQAFGTPDTAVISAGVQTQAKTAAQALSDNASRMNAVFGALKRMGIPDKDIQTSDFSIFPQMSQTEPQHIVGYQVTNQVTVTVDGTNKVGPAIDTLVSAGANQMNNISFSIHNADALLAKARTAAVADATARAQLLTNAAHVKLGPIISIEENAVENIHPIPMMAMRAMAAPTPVAAGQQTIGASVSITWQIQ
jgi:uncharacterized protein YggE